MSINYQNLIRESEEDLLDLEKKHRSTHLSHRLRMLRLLKSETSKSIQQAADMLGYSWRQCQRWITTYRQEGLDALLIDQTRKRGNHKERVTPEAWASLGEAMKRASPKVLGRAPWDPLQRPEQYLQALQTSPGEGQNRALSAQKGRSQRAGGL